MATGYREEAQHIASITEAASKVPFKLLLPRELPEDTYFVGAKYLRGQHSLMRRGA